MEESTVIVSTKFQIPHIRNTLVPRPKLMRKLLTESGRASGASRHY